VVGDREQTDGMLGNWGTGAAHCWTRPTSSSACSSYGSISWRQAQVVHPCSAVSMPTARYTHCLLLSHPLLAPCLPLSPATSPPSPPPPPSPPSPVRPLPWPRRGWRAGWPPAPPGPPPPPRHGAPQQQH
jgi:hypothetical protein